MLTIKTRLQVKDIIRYLDMCSHIVIEQLDVSLEGDDSEEIYNGSVMDIPWYIMDYYLANTADYEALGTFNYTKNENSTSSFFLTVVEDENRLDQEHN